MQATPRTTPHGSGVGVGDAIELRFELLEPSGLRLERGQEAAQLTRRLPQAQLGVPQLVAGTRELRRQRLDRRKRALCVCNEPGRTVALVGSERVGRCRGSFCELGDVPKPLALCAQRLLRVGLEARRVFHECTELRKACLRGDRARLKLVVPSPRGKELAPGDPRFGAQLQLVVADERVEHIELVRGPAEPALLELPRHRDQPLPGCGEVPRGPRRAPRHTRGPPVREDPAGDEQPFLVLGTKLRERLEFLLL